MLRGSGGGAPRTMFQHMWLWPLPLPGDLTFAFAWPKAGVPEHVVSIEAAPLLEAAHRAEELWADHRPLPDGEGGGDMRIV